MHLFRCFIQNIYAALGGVIVPSVICVVIATGVLIYMLRLSLIWQFDKNIYSDYSNISGIGLYPTLCSVL